MSRGDRCRHSGEPSHHERVAFVSFLLVTRHAIRPLAYLGPAFGGIDRPVNRAAMVSCFPSPLWERVDRRA